MVPALSLVPWPAQIAARPGIYARDTGARIVVERDDALRRAHGDEAYSIEAGPQGIRVRAGGAAGAFYATRTLAQLARADGSIPGVSIRDWPRFRWRGLELDVARHFFDVATLEREVDLCARYKLNVLHLHLTDDAAWRLPSARYPRLPSVPSYSRAEISRLLAYARARFVRVVPELEVPGHNDAALRAYPALAQTPQFWGALVREAASEFGGPYLHLGGDEVRYDARRIALLEGAARAASAARRLPVVWDDAQSVRLPQTTVYLVWRRYAGLQSALHSGHPVVLAPDGPYYFDAYQGSRTEEPPASPHMATLEQVYDYDPPANGRVLGVQANLWTERIATRAHLEYMLAPRLLALAESAWSNPARKDWNRFVAALPAQLAALDRTGTTYRIPGPSIDVSGAQYGSVAGNAAAAYARSVAPVARISLRVPLARQIIYYTTDGTMPGPASSRYAGPFTLEVRGRNRTVKAVAYVAGRRGALSTCYITFASAGAPGASRSWGSVVSP